MRRSAFCVLFLMAVAPAVMGQGITGFTGGSLYGSYYGSLAPGDVIGFRFTVSAPYTVASLGVYNADTNGLTSSHQVGIWDGAQTLIASVTVDPATGTPIGNWTYASITPVTLMPGQTYTAGAAYTTDDDDSYISGASAVTTDPVVTWLNAVYPTAGDLGFVYPGLDSSPTSGGRFGPNFTDEVVPVELQSFTIE
jgi:hypothetical protein